MKYQINSEKILFTQVGEEGVLYDTENNAYVSVNETLYKILRGISEGLSRGEIIEQLREEYDVSQEQCSEEVDAALEKLAGGKFIIRK